MAIEFQINGNASGLGNAVQKSVGMLNSLKQVAGDIKLNLLGATSEKQLNLIGSALTTVNGRITELTRNALQNNEAFRDQQAAATLETLSQKLAAVTGNAQLFGTSIKTQQAEVNAYQSAISRLLSAGIDPFDARVQRLKASVDTLNASIASQQAHAAMQAQLARSGGLIDNLKQKIDQLNKAKGTAALEQDIARYNKELKVAQTELARLNALGTGFGTTAGLIQRAEAKINGLKQAMRGAVDEKSLARYNTQLIATQKELERLTRVGLSAADASRRMGAGFNTVGLEFGRIIQDAPYMANNFGSIGNNITRLVELIPGYIAQTRAMIVANGGVATSALVTRTALMSMITGWGGITIAISAVVTAYTLYSMRAKKANQTTEEFIKTLDDLTQARVKGAGSSAKEVLELRNLYSASQDATRSYTQRKIAVDQLQKQYPSFFGNLSDEAILVGKAESAYNALTTSIQATARAQAGLEMQVELEKELLAIREKRVQALAKLMRYEADAASMSGKNRRVGEMGGSASAAFALGGGQQRKEWEAEEKRLKALETAIEARQKRLSKQTDKEQRKVDPRFGQDEVKSRNATNAALEKQITLEEQLRNIRQRTTDSASLAGLEGYEAQAQKVINTYNDLQKDLDAVTKRIGADTKLSADARGKALAEVAAISGLATLNKDKELNALRIAEEERVAAEVERIRSAAGIKTEELRSKELAAIEKRYASEVQKAQGNADILKAIEEAKAAEVGNVNIKYLQKEQDLYDKINAIQDQALAHTGNSEQVQTARIIAEWEKRKKAAIEYFDILRKLVESDTTKSAEQKSSEIAKLDAAQGTIIKQIEAAVKIDINRGESDKIAKEMARTLQQATRSFATNFYSVLTGLNNEADRTFTSLFSKLTTGLSQSMEGIFQNIATKYLADKLKKGVEDGTGGLEGLLKSKFGAALAGAGLAGGIISGATNKTSSIGQGLGGALSGAASGALAGTAIAGPVGTVVGGIVGGLAGAIGGLFGAGKARKEERKLQEQQLAEAKRQTELMRQQAQAYTSQLIGRMTTNGVINQIEVNAFGELETRISGKDLQFVLDRSNNSR